MGEEAGQKEIGFSVLKKDHKEKVEGSIQYISDVQIENRQHALLYRSPIAYGRIKEIQLPLLPKGYTIIGAKDVPGGNFVKILKEDQPIFANDWVSYIGEPILMLIGEDKAKLHHLKKQIFVTFEEHTPTYTLEEAIAKKDKGNQEGVLASYQFGEPLQVLSEIEKKAHTIIEEDYFAGYQEHVYLEPQGMLGIYTDKEIIVQGSMQCPYYIKNALISALACKEEEVRVIQSPTGGGFGGKEDYPSLMACHVAIAAKVVKKPVLLLLERGEDMVVTTKRHPAKIKYRTALDEEGHLKSMQVEIYLDGGANLGLSPVVLQRALINSAGVYRIPHFSVKGYVLKTNTVPNGAFRGFGAPQSFIGIESHMEHISKRVKQDPLTYKRKYLVKQGDSTSTKGRFRDPILMEEMIVHLMEKSAYQTKKEAFKKHNGQNTRYKKGMGTSLFLHGCGFTGSGERDHIKATVKLVKSKEDSVYIYIANVDMGQGLLTTMSKIVAKVLDLNYQEILYPYPDTSKVPDSGPTVASRTTMIVGKLLERAAIRLKKKWETGKEQEITEHYVHEEMIPWDEASFSGDAYPAYSWGVNMAEVEVDTVTGTVTLQNLYAAYDIGKAIDERIIKGQIEGGMVQGIGYGMMEKMTTKEGKIQQKTITDYGPPTAMDIVPIYSKLFDNPYAGGPYGAKGAGELTLIGGAPAVALAIEDAVGVDFHQVPVTPEVIMQQID
jgi:CO/xanthine dehydrogenase Mo-binding subunit